MPTIWVYSDRVADTVQEWVEDADWDQQSWDEWDRMEAMHQRDMLRRMTPTPTPNVVPWFARSTDYWHLWYNMRDDASSPRTTNAVRDLMDYEYANWMESFPPGARRPRF